MKFQTELFLIISTTVVFTIGIPVQADVSGPKANRCAPVAAALKSGNYDTAFVRLQEAYSAGLTEDSLYYYWAQIYLDRGVSDTALALNLAANRSSSTSFVAEILMQRISIYLTLGWKKEAMALLDSLRSNETTSFSLLPTITLESQGGVNNRFETDGGPQPFILPDKKLRNPFQEFSGKIGWYVPLGKKAILLPGVVYNFTNGIEQTEIRRDSLNHSWGLSLDAKNIGNRMSVSYSLLRRHSMYKDSSWQNTLALSHFHQGDRWLTYSGLTYTNDFGATRKFNYHSLWFMHYLSRPLTSSLTLSFMPLLTCFLAQDERTIYPASLMFIESPQGSPYVTHYTDSTCTETIPFPVWPFQFIDEQYLPASVQRNYRYCAPESYIGIAPSASLSRLFSHGFSIEGTLKGMANYYIREYEWTTYGIPYSAGNYLDGSLLAYSKSDERYYIVKDFYNIANEEKYSGPIDIRSYKKRRVDGALGGEIAIDYRLGSIGTLGMNGKVTKYWSTLGAGAPVEIKSFIFTAGVSFKAALGRKIPINAL